MKLSVIITAKDRNDPKLKDLEWSIKQQTFKDYEVIIVTEGNSESAKAIGLKRAKGQIVCILASDNYLNDNKFFERCLEPFKDPGVTGSYPMRYYYYEYDDILNRYFALFGFNDPVPYYLKKNDKLPYFQTEYRRHDLDFIKYGEYFFVKFYNIPTLGDNGMFVRKDILMKADIDHYFHIDVFQDLFDLGYKTYALVNTSIWHKTGGNIFKFFKKRLSYADKFLEGRRWHMVEKDDIIELMFFIFSTLTLVYPIYLSLKGYNIIRDKAWFLHLPICLITIGVYGIWTLKKLMLKLVK